jgi:hypothetical protein
MTTQKPDPSINVCNIRASDANDWQGETTAPGQAFEHFKDVPSNLRACGKLLLKYQARGARTAYQLAEKYAPPSENDTLNYAKALAKAVGCAIRDRIDVTNPATMAKLLAIIPVLETGYRCTPDQIAAAVAMLFGHAS